jgi:hypothetical protein
LLAKLEGSIRRGQDLWLADGKARLLPINACAYRENDPFAALRNSAAQGHSKPL